VSESSFFRKDVAELYGIQSIVLEPRGKSVIEIGIASRSWPQMPPLPASECWNVGVQSTAPAVFSVVQAALV